MIGVGRPLLKAWSLVGHGPKGAAIMRNPPPHAFRPEGEDDIPAHAHDGHGGILEGQWLEGEHGQKTWQTDFGGFHHPVDAVAHKLGDFLRARGLNVSPAELINASIEQFNDTHSHGDAHQLARFESPEWRKIRAADVPPGDSTRELSNRPTRTQGGTKITMLTNKNQNDTPVGKFIEGGYIPFHRQLIHQLEDLGIPQQEIKQGLGFLKYPWMQPHHLGPKGYLVANQKQHGADVDEAMMSRGPEGFFGDTEKVHTWEVMHHLPDAFFYPVLNKKGTQKSGKEATGLYSAAHKMIDQALQSGLEHIPNTEVTINTGTMGAPNMIQRPLHEILQTPDLREAMVKDMAHVPAMMFLFGRSGQGNFKKLYDHMMQKYGATENMLSPEEQAKYLAAGEKGGKGMHESAKRMFALARGSGEGSEEGRSRFSEHPITAEEIKTLGMYHSDNLMNQVDRFRSVLEALADHQAGARGHEVKRGLGDVPTTARPGMSIAGYPTLDEETGEYSMPPLDPHMDAYFHDIHDFAPTEAFDPSLTQSPGREVSSPSLAVPSPTAPPASLPSARPGGTYPHTPMQQFQQVRPQIGQFSPEQYRQMLEAAGRRRPQPLTDAPLTDVERRSQQAFADPQQTMLSQYYKSMDSAMNDVMKIIKGGRR